MDTQTFHRDVAASPGITIIAREAFNPTRIAHRGALDGATLSALADGLTVVSRADDLVAQQCGREDMKVWGRGDADTRHFAAQGHKAPWICVACQDQSYFA